MAICGTIRGLIHGQTGGTEFVMQRSMIKKIPFVLATTIVTTLAASPLAFAQDGAPTAFENERASKHLTLGAQVDLLPYGKISGGSDSNTFNDDAAFAYGVAANLDLHLSRFLSIGLAPRLIFNVTTKDQDSDQEDADALKQFDARVRVKGEFPVGTMLDLYGYVAPGYSWILADDNTFGPVTVNDAKGLVVAFAVGTAINLTPAFFLNAELSYQLGFQQSSASIGGAESDDFDFKTDYLSIGLGAGARF
jgi:hypothetical protein